MAEIVPFDRFPEPSYLHPFASNSFEWWCITCNDPQLEWNTSDHEVFDRYREWAKANGFEPFWEVPF